MNICCEQTVVKQDEEYYLYKGYSNKQQARVPIRQSQVNPIISKTQQPYRMVLKSKLQNEMNNCQESKKQFDDKNFPANAKSLGAYQGKRKIEWVRLSKIIQKIGKQSFNPLQILSMKQGDSFFLASLAALCNWPSSIQQVFGQQLSINSIGAYSLNLNINGKPQQIVIDDYLPVFYDNKRRALFCSIDPENIWVPLFQKAYAKIKGSYQNIEYGYAHSVLSTFSEAPCTYQIIPTDFRHNQQQKCWKNILYAFQMKFPIVAGSRKKNNNSIILPNQTYCIKNCQIIQKNKTQEKRIILWNLPGKRLGNQSLDMKYEEDGNAISLNIVQFMRNFQVYDVAHVRKHFSSHFYQFKCSPDNSVLYEFATNINSVLYLTLQKMEGEQGKLRILLINCSNEATYQFVAGKRQEVYSDVTIHVQTLPPGNYIVICQATSNCSCLLRVYSPMVIALVKFLGNKNTLLQRTFMQLAYSSKQEQVKLSKQINDWYISKILFDDLGLAFFMVNLDWKSIIKCSLSFNRMQLLEQGIDIVNKPVTEGYSSTLQKGQSDILIFDFIGKFNQAYNFPPNSLRINITI